MSQSSDRELGTSAGAAATTMHVRAAMRGEASSLAWVVERFSPLLEEQARYRLRGPLSRYCSAADLVQEVWAVALPRLPALEARDGRWTPVLVRFLSTTLLYKANGIARSYIRRDRPRLEASGSSVRLSGLASGIDVVEAAQAAETCARVRAALAELGERDREVLTLRGIEQQSNKRVAELLGETQAAVSIRYRRALERLRDLLPESVFAELAADGEEPV